MTDCRQEPPLERCEAPSSASADSGVDDDTTDRNRFVLEHRWIAERCARRFTRRGEPYDDLLQVAYLGLVKAADRFDPSMGNSFSSFAMPTVLGELRRHFRDRTWVMQVPRRSKDLITQMNAAIETLYQRQQRMPDADEVAAELRVDVEAVLETMEARGAYRPGSLHLVASDTERDGTGIARIETIGDDDASLVDAADRMTTFGALRSLDPRTRRILVWRFYEGRTQSEIGERLGIGQVQVSRLLRAALVTVRQTLEDDDVDEPGDERQRGEVRIMTTSKSDRRRRLVDTLLDCHGTTYAAEVGINVERGTPAPLFQLLTLTLLLSARIRADAAVSAARRLRKEGLTTAKKMAEATWEARTTALNEAGYARYDESTSRMLGATATHIVDAYGGDLRRLRDEAERDPSRERTLLKECKGIGDVGVDIFFREAQVVWDELMPFADHRARRVADSLGLPKGASSLRDLVTDDRSFARLVSALVRTDLAGDVDDIQAAARRAA